jgi:polysaccharide pyruvyl transferase WcaK-like protein
MLLARKTVKEPTRPGPGPRVGFFGHLGACNIGNDASMEAVLGFLRDEHPDAVVDAMCPGPQNVTDRYGIPAIPIFWYLKHEQRSSAGTAVVLKALGKGIDAFRTAAWVRRHDVVIVPGAGVLEASLPLWPWGMPYALCVLSASGRLFGTKVALVSVGAGAIRKRATRWLSNSAARLAFYRSYRDPGAREALQRRGVDTTGDRVYPDLAFALPAPGDDAGDPRLVGVGVMAYYGSNDERKEADRIYAEYVTAMTRFVEWLLDNGRRVRLFVGDTNGSDDSVVQEILAEVRASRSGLDPSSLEAVDATSFTDVMKAMLPVGIVVAMRYHNIVCALKLSKPTISISYSPKHDVLMAEMGLGDFCQPVNELDVDRLIEQFEELERRASDVRPPMQARNAAKTRLGAEQFAELSAVLFDSPERQDAASGRQPVAAGVTAAVR